MSAFQQLKDAGVSDLVLDIRYNGGGYLAIAAEVASMIAEVLNAIAQSSDGSAPLVEAAVKERVKALTDRFPIYQ